MNTNDSGRKSKLGRWGVRVAILAACVMAFYAFEHWRGWRAWSSFRTEWEAKGENFERPQQPAVPDDQDASKTPLIQELTAIWRSHPELFDDQKLPGDRGRLHELGSALTLYLKRDRNPASRPHFRVAPFAGAEWRRKGGEALADDEALAVQQVIERFDAYAETFTEIDAMLTLPALTVPERDETDPAAVSPPHAAVLASVARAHLLRARALLRTGYGSAAMADIDRSIIMINWLRETDCIMSNGPFHTLLYMVQDGLERELWDAQELLRLQRQLGAIDLAPTLLAALRHWRAIDIEAATSAKLRALYNEGLKVSNARMRRMAPVAFEDSRGYPWYEPLRPQGWRYLALRERLATWQNIVFTKADGAVNSETLTADMVDATVALRKFLSDDENRFEEMIDWSLRKLGGKGLRDQRNRSLQELSESAAFLVDGYGFRPKVRQSLAIVAIALERHKLRNGAYPVDVGGLVPEFLDTAPVDPWAADGALLRYVVRPNGRPAIWSIGENREDDNGDEDSDDRTWDYTPAPTGTP